LAIADRRDRRTSIDDDFLSLEAPGGCGFSKNDPSGSSGSSFPVEAKFGCFRLSMLSRQHFTMLINFSVGGFLVLAAVIRERYVSLVSLSICELCLLVILSKFAEIDIVQQLDREVDELKTHNKDVEVQKDTMTKFWNNTRALTELWLYRTVPRLDLSKELHGYIEDAKESELSKNLESINNCLEKIEDNLGSLQDWREDGDIAEADKKAFGKAMAEVCHEQNIGGIVQSLQDIANGSVMKNFAILNAPRPMSFVID